MDHPSRCGDDALWPSQSDCSGHFDFSLLFEQSFLSLTPSAALLLAASFRIVSLKSKPRRIRSGKFLCLKLVTLALYATLQLALLVGWCLERTEANKISISSAVLSLANSIVCCWLSYLEHIRSLQPSSILSIYFFFTLFFDGVQTRTLWLNGYSELICSIFTTSFATKAVILILEAWEKTPYLATNGEDWSPEETSGIFNRSVFYWLNKILLLGYRKIILPEDLYPLDKQIDSSRLHAHFEKYWAKTGTNLGQYRILLALLRSHWRQLMLPIIPRLLLIGFTFAQPLLLHRTLDLLQQKSLSDSLDTSHGLIGAYAIVYIGLAVCTGFYWHKQFKCLTMIRGSTITAIYRKTLEVNDGNGSTTLMSTDVERITTGIRYIHEIWANVVELGIGIWLLERELGVASVAPVAVAVVCSLASTWVNSFAPKRQMAWMTALQGRVDITAAALSSLKSIKMVGLADKLVKLIQSLRINELKLASGFRIVLASNLCIAFVPQFISPVASFAVFMTVLHRSGRALNTTRAFTSLSLLVIVSKPLSQLFQLIPLLIAALGCLKRVQTFLELPSQPDNRIFPTNSEDSPAVNIGSIHGNESNPAIELQSRCSFKDTVAGTENVSDTFVVQNATLGWHGRNPVLQNISLTIPRSKLTIVIGPVASGKSTLCKALLGEAFTFRGSVQFNPKARSTDIAFCDQSPFLLNASMRENILGFSSFDSEWYETVINSVGLLDDIKALPDGDHTLVGSNGVALSNGQKQRIAIARAVYSRKQTAIFDDIFSGLDSSTEQVIFDKVFSSEGLLRMHGTTIILFVHATKFLPMADHIIVLDGRGGVEQGTFQNLSATSSYLHNSMSLLIDHQPSTSDPDISKASSTTTPQAVKRTADSRSAFSRQQGDWAIYQYYFRAVGIRNTMILLTFGLLIGFTSTFPSIWITWWTNSDTQNENVDNGRYLGIYTLLQVLGLLTFGLYLYHCLNTVATSSGISLHHTALRSVMSATMAFISNTDIGVTISRFSQDMELIDGELPQALMNLVFTIFTIIGQAILIAIATPYVTISFPVLILVFFWTQRFYLRTSRQLRILDLETKSPLYTHFLESSNGISSIRPFGWRQKCLEICYQRLNTSQRPYYLLLMIQQWLSLVLNLVAAALAIMVSALAIELRTDSGFTGVALVNLVTFNSTLGTIIVAWALTETSIGAVSRIKQLEDNIIPEGLPNETVSPPDSWPEHGSIDLNAITASYDLNSGLDVLTDINLSVRGGEKIGICGRSGSGKSSFLLALFRMIELRRGSILIDGVDLCDLSRNALRARLNVVPQDPFFLPGTVRLNLDPSAMVPDSEIISALQEVQLWPVIESRGGLSSEMKSSHFSQGEKQLFCFARVLLRPDRKILVLDEATSSLDFQTDAMVQRIIRKLFAHHTIIAVAHRIETILDFDRVAVFSEGRLVELGPPAVLRQRQGSLFRELCEGRAAMEA